MPLHAGCLPAFLASAVSGPFGLEYFFAGKDMVGSRSATIKRTAVAKWVVLAIILVCVIVLNILGSNPVHHIKSKDDEAQEPSLGARITGFLMIAAIFVLVCIWVVAPFISLSGCLTKLE